MLKIISKKEYQKLINIENKYRELTGQTITFWTGQRSRYKALLSMNKEELVHRLLDMNNACFEISKRKIKNSNLNEIHEKLNEIQYLLKFTYSKKKIRRKVIEVMNLIENVGDENV